MSSPQEWLAKSLARMQGLRDPDMTGLTEDERAVVLGMKAQATQMEYGALADIIQNCHNKYQFAKTYKVLRADLGRMLSQSGNPKASERVNRAVKEAFQSIGQQKLTEMAGWFFIQFADDRDRARVSGTQIEKAIEAYAGPPGGGCAGTILLAAGAGVSWLASRAVL